MQSNKHQIKCTVNLAVKHNLFLRAILWCHDDLLRFDFSDGFKQGCSLLVIMFADKSIKLFPHIIILPKMKSVMHNYIFRSCIYLESMPGF